MTRPDIRLKAGDYLIAIDGHPVKAGDDYWKLLQVVSGQKVKVCVNDTAAEESARTYEVELLRSDRDLRYFHWLTENIRKVLAATDGRVGYMHINAMVLPALVNSTSSGAPSATRRASSSTCGGTPAAGPSTS